MSAQEIAVIPSGVASLDEATGIGGYPKGRLIEISGTGRMALAFLAAVEVQRANGIVAFVDTKHVFDIDAAAAAGLDVSKILVSQPDNVVQALEIADVLMRSGAVDLVVIDEIEPGCDDTTVSAVAGELSQVLRSMAAVAFRVGSTAMFLTEPASPIQLGFRPGTNAVRYYSSLRIDVRGIGGSMVRAKVVKNKLAAPFQDAEFELPRKAA